MSAIPQALAGLRVLEFGAYAAGPHIGKMLAAFGASVVHVESRQRPDGFRCEYPPCKGGRAGPDRGGCFAIFNDSKLAVTLNLKAAAGTDLARRLMAWSHVVVENMRPGVMARLGLGYDAIRTLNPQLVMLSTCNMGQTGPRAHVPGFGSQLSALAGFCGLTGMPDDSPMLLYGPYIDFIASTIGASAVLAALDRRQRTGQGAYIDLSQYEAGLMFMAGALLEYHETGVDSTRAGNKDPGAAPHDAYRCAGNGWVAISCWSDAEFRRLAGALGRPDLAADPRFGTLTSRQRHLQELTREVERWTAERAADEAAAQLQAAGVHAHRVNDIADLFRDPQLAYRRIWRRRRHPVMGEVSCYFSAFDLAGVPGDVTAAAPRLGADNEYVFQELLGMTADEYAACAAQGAFD